MRSSKVSLSALRTSEADICSSFQTPEFCCCAFSFWLHHVTPPPPAGARLHREPPEEGDAVSVRPGEEEGGADHEAAGDLHHPAERAPHQPRRLPQRHQDAGTDADRK